MANEVDLFRYSVALPQRSGEDARYQFLSSLQQTLPGFLQCSPCRDGFSHVGAFETQIYQIPTESESRNQHTGCVCSRDKRRHQDGHSLSECSLAVPHPGLRFFQLRPQCGVFRDDESGLSLCLGQQRGAWHCEFLQLEPWMGRPSQLPFLLVKPV